MLVMEAIPLPVPSGRFGSSFQTVSAGFRSYYVEVFRSNVTINPIFKVTFKPMPSAENARSFLEAALYPTLTKGLAELCKEKPANPAVILNLRHDGVKRVLRFISFV
jgi:hypothetical protein